MTDAATNDKKSQPTRETLQTIVESSKDIRVKPTPSVLMEFLNCGRFCPDNQTGFLDHDLGEDVDPPPFTRYNVGKLHRRAPRRRVRNATFCGSAFFRSTCTGRLSGASFGYTTFTGRADANESHADHLTRLTRDKLPKPVIRYSRCTLQRTLSSRPRDRRCLTTERLRHSNRRSLSVCNSRKGLGYDSTTNESVSHSVSIPTFDTRLPYSIPSSLKYVNSTLPIPPSPIPSRGPMP